MDGSADLFGAQRGDDAFDLPPVAETHHIARIAAALGANRGFEAGIVTEAVDKFGGIVERAAPRTLWIGLRFGG